MVLIQVQVINAILDRKDPSIITINNLDDSFFSDCPAEFNYIKDHYNSYGQLPDKATFFNKFPSFNNIEVNEPTNYLIDTLYDDKNSRFLANSFNIVREKVMKGEINEALNAYVTSVDQAAQCKHLQTVDLLQDSDIRYNAYVEKCNDFGKYYVSTGFPELDSIIGGWDRLEELATIVARPNVGKSWILLKCAAAAIEQGLRVGIYSGEMTANKVGYRMDTMLGHVSNSGLIRGRIEVQSQYKDFLNRLKIQFPNACCKVLTPASINGPAGITALRSFIEKENLDILFVDQHSLLEDDRNAKNPVERASNISKDLKNLQVLKKIPIIAVSQQNRSTTENGVGTEHVAQSDRISQDSTIVIFLEQDKDHKLLTMQLVKSRDSVNMKKLTYLFNFDKGTFEYQPTEEDKNNPELNNRIQELNAKFESDYDIDYSQSFGG